MTHLASQIDTAIIYAAGHGKRMMPLTAACPKPMLSVAGKPLLAHALEKMAQASLRHVVVNTHHCASVAEDFLAAQKIFPSVQVSHEDTLLETGGGTKYAIQKGLLPSKDPFYAINADTLWTDGPSGPALARLRERFEALGSEVDVLLLLMPKEKAWGHEGPKADYNLDPQTGRITRLSSTEAATLYAGVQIVRPELYRAPHLGDAFSNLKIFDAAQAQGRLYGLEHDGGWYHFSTPSSLEAFEREVSL